MIQWPCRQCGEELEAPESLGSDSIECPSCGVFSRPPDDLRPRAAYAPKPKQPPPDDAAFSPPKGAGHTPSKETLNTPQREAGKFKFEGPIGVVWSGWIILSAGFVFAISGLLDDHIVHTIFGVGIGASGVVLVGLGTVGKAIVASITRG